MIDIDRYLSNNNLLPYFRCQVILEDVIENLGYNCFFWKKSNKIIVDKQNKDFFINKNEDIKYLRYEVSLAIVNIIRNTVKNDQTILVDSSNEKAATRLLLPFITTSNYIESFSRSGLNTITEIDSEEMCLPFEKAKQSIKNHILGEP